MKARKTSNKYFKQALTLMPGGVNSPVRAFTAVGGKPVFISRGKGAKIWDVDGNSYIDYVLSWGPLILGHAPIAVVNSLIKAAKHGTSFGASTKAEIEIAEIIKEAFPGMEHLRLVNSGTEATMSAIRLARSYTGRNKIVKFEGCYHGHSDSLLVKAGSGAATFSVPTSRGVPPDVIKNTIVLPYNDISRLDSVIASYHRQIAAVIIEPVCGNMGVVMPNMKFLNTLRAVTKKYGILLIFDEVITGFRFCFGGVQKLFRIKPDITCLGKVIGGGLPIGAYGAAKKIMKHVAPSGSMYQAGTLSGNPVAIACGLKTLQFLRRADYARMNALCEKLATSIEQLGRDRQRKVRVNYFGSMFTVFFTDKKVTDYETACSSNTKDYSFYFSEMLKRGVYLPPSQFESNFLSFAHTKKDIEYTLDQVKAVFLNWDR